MQTASRRALAITLIAASLASPSTTRADDQTRAEQLFDEGRKRMTEPGGLAEACRLLEESYKVFERGDTLLNLAECHRRQGRTATAWAEFDQAIGHGEKVKFTRAIEVARKLRDELAAKLSSLTVGVAAETAKLEGLEITVNGKPWPLDRLNMKVHHDPGPLAVKAVAPGFKPFTTDIVLGNDRDDKTVTITLEREPPPPPPSASSSAPPPPPPPPSSSPPPPPPPPARPVWPYVVGGTGVALGVAAVVFALDQRSASNELDERCGTSRKSCPPGYDFGATRSRELRDFGLFVGLGVVGVAGIATGAIALGLGGAKASTSLHLGPDGAALRGAF